MRPGGGELMPGYQETVCRRCAQRDSRDIGELPRRSSDAFSNITLAETREKIFRCGRLLLALKAFLMTLVQTDFGTRVTRDDNRSPGKIDNNCIQSGW